MNPPLPRGFRRPDLIDLDRSEVGHVADVLGVLVGPCRRLAAGVAPLGISEGTAREILSRPGAKSVNPLVLDTIAKLALERLGRASVAVDVDREALLAGRLKLEGPRWQPGTPHRVAVRTTARRV